MPRNRVENAGSIFKVWYDGGMIDPPTRKGMAVLLHVKQGTLRAWIRKEEEKLVDWNLVTYMKGRSSEWAEAIVDSAKKGNAQSQKLITQITGDLIEKSEVNIGLTADETHRRNLEADRKLREMGYRVEALPKEPEVFLNQLCVDSESKYGEDSQVGTLAVSP